MIFIKQENYLISDKWLNRLIERFTEIYKELFTKDFITEEQTIKWKREWSLELDGLSKEEIAKAIEECKERYFLPPSAETFKLIAKGLDKPVVKEDEPLPFKRTEYDPLDPKAWAKWPRSSRAVELMFTPPIMKREIEFAKRGGYIGENNQWIPPEKRLKKS